MRKRPEKKGKRVLLVLNSDFGVGNTIGARALPIAREAKRRGNEVIVICRSGDATLKGEFEVITPIIGGKAIMQALTAIPIYISKSAPASKWKNALFDAAVKRILRRGTVKDVDIVHAWESLPKAFAFIRKENPRTMILQDLPIALPNVLDDVKGADKLFTRSERSVPEAFIEAKGLTDRFITPSAFVQESLVRVGVSRKRIAIIPFGVDTKRFRPVDKGERPFRVAFSGNVNNRKGIPDLVSAWKGIALPKSELHLYGRVYPETRECLRDAAKHRIIIHGFCETSRDLPKNHLFVFPTLMEGSAKSTYEALACGLPVITTRNAGSVVRNGREGMIIEARDEKALEKGIERYASDRKMLKRHAEAARKRAIGYTWERYASAVVDEYERMRR
jgi:glycosyltransferase involved in cell wall biosynthesis